ncbi:MAG: methyl-accepting chemotaxis protein [bacterium]|jgi:methyl-accepting chemotaxis protein|nr:MAG: hypothetical protein DIU52_10185 [bacterium]
MSRFQFFDRIRDRLVAAFTVLMAGTVVTWWFGTANLKETTRDVTTSLDRLQESAELGARLESLILEQIANGERYLVSGARAAAESFRRLGLEAHRLRGDYANLPDLTADERKQIVRIEELHSRLEVDYSLAHALRDLGRPGEAAQRVAAVEPDLNELGSVIRSLGTAQAAKVNVATRTLQQQATQRQFTLAAVMIVSAILGFLLIRQTLLSIDRPLTALVGAADMLGSGNLDVQVGGRMSSEFGVLANAFTSMAARLRTIVAETAATAEQISASASDLSSISEEVAASSGEVSSAMVGITAGAEEQATGLRTVQSAVSEMRRRAGEIGESSRRVRELGHRIAGVAGEKRQDLARALGVLLEVREAVQASAAEVTELAQASDKIDAFVETIQGIARQTNLLALNAAIEAARAGEHGRGFAVVAEEVRKLADGSARAADEVAGTVRLIRKQIQDVVAAMEAGSAKVAGVEEESKGAERAFEEIIQAVAQVGEAAERVAAVAEESMGVLETIEQTVERVGSTAEAHAASAQEVSAAAEEQSAATEEMSAASVELLQAAERLKELVSGFKFANV